MTALVGLIGKKRAGKDSVATTLVEEFGFARVAFADPLKAVALQLDPIVKLQRVEPYGDTSVRLSELVARAGWETAKETAEVRRTLQRLGVAVRSVDEGFWLRQGLESIAGSRARGVVVTDVRFPNEAAHLRNLGGLLLRVHRPSSSRGHDPHESETALDDYPVDGVLSNDGTLDHLAAQVRAVASRLQPLQSQHV